MRGTRRARRGSPAARRVARLPDEGSATDPQAPPDTPAGLGGGTVGRTGPVGSAGRAADATMTAMLTPRSRWTFPDPVEIPALLREEGARRGLSTRVLEVLVRRGLLEGG